MSRRPASIRCVRAPAQWGDERAVLCTSRSENTLTAARGPTPSRINPPQLFSHCSVDYYRRQRTLNQAPVAERRSRSRLTMAKWSRSIATDQECLDFARECVRLAETTSDQDLQDHLLTLARQWMTAAGRKDRTAEPSTGKPLASGL